MSSGVGDSSHIPFFPSKQPLITQFIRKIHFYSRVTIKRKSLTCSIKLYQQKYGTIQCDYPFQDLWFGNTECRQYRADVLNVLKSGIEFTLQKSEFRVVKSEFRVTKASFELTKASLELTKASFELQKASFELTKASFELLKASFELLKASFELQKASFELLKASFELQKASFEFQKASFEF